MTYPTAKIETTKGPITVELWDDVAPNHAENFQKLAKSGFYDGVIFHRIIPGFMIQGGCPLGTGTGDPGYRFEDEFVPELRHSTAGKLSMANAGPGTNGSQFFITHVPTPHLDDAHTIFGEVVGEDDQKVVNAIAKGDLLNSISIEGESDALLATMADRITQWNKSLDK